MLFPKDCITLVPINRPGGGLAEHYYRRCRCCYKDVTLSRAQEQAYEKLSSGWFYCPFCLRHGFDENRDVLVLSFRGIVGHYYHNLYKRTPRTLWLAEIEDQLSRHERAGLRNPTFCYDPDTFLWFVDCSKVGTQMPAEDILATISNILMVFDRCSERAEQSFFNKMQKAILRFLADRYRPKGRRFLIPTVAAPRDKCRNFSPNDLKPA